MPVIEYGSSIRVSLHEIHMQQYMHATKDMISISNIFTFHMKAAIDKKDHTPTDKDAETLI